MTENQILIISFWNPTAENPHQGVFIQDQVAAICRLRENVIFLQVNILPSNCIFLKKTIEDSAFFNNKKITINLYSRLWKFLYVNPWWSSRILYRIIKKREDEINPAIIHTNVIFPCGVVGHLLARRMGAKHLISEHWSKAEKLLKHPLYKRIVFNAYHNSYAVICVSEFLLKRISRATGLTNLITIPNIIDTEIFTYLSKPPVEDGSLIMLCVASWQLPKRLDLIFDALCAYASETSRKIELTVVGKGTRVVMLKNRKTPYNLHVGWAGYLDRTAIARLLQKTHVFLHASNIETFSIVTAEALSTGTPVLASNTGALPELINDENGLLVENTPDGWLNGIRKIVTKQFDCQVIAFQNQNKYSPTQIGNSIISLYNKINTGLSLSDEN